MISIIDNSWKEFFCFMNDQDSPKNNNYAYEVIYENDILNPWKLIIKK